ncbi:MAG: hypothetical protein ACMUIP_13380 [bacterium]
MAKEIVDKGFRITFDLLVKVGLLRYRDYRQLEEIQAFLKCSAKFDLPISTIGVISKRFLEFCKLLHMKYEYKINEDIKSNGGYILHFDGTTEKKCGKLSFVMMDSLSGHILVCEMIESEKYEHVIKFLEQIKSKYGNPLATLSDLKPGFLSASEDTFKGKVLHIFCHYHFLGTFKEDFIKHHHFIKARLVSTWKIQSGLKKHLMALEKSRAQRQVFKNFEEIEKYWISSKNTLETYRHVLVWILKFKQDSSGKGIPFDLPYLDFYSRFMKGKKLIDSIFKEADARVENHYKIFNAIMSKAKNNGIQCKEFKQEVSILRYSRKWFNKLRGALFLGTIHEKRDALAPLSTRYRLTEEEARLIPQNLTWTSQNQRGKNLGNNINKVCKALMKGSKVQRSGLLFFL